MNTESLILLVQFIALILFLLVGFYWPNPRVRLKLRVGIYIPWIIMFFVALFSAYTGDFTPKFGLILFLIALSFSSFSAIGLSIALRNRKNIQER